MDFALSPEQRLIESSVRRFVAEHAGFERRSAAAADPRGFSAAHWSIFADLGWLGLGVPEDRGGYGASAVDTMIVMEGIGAGLVLGPFASSVVVASGVLAAPGAPASYARSLEAVLSGTATAALAYAEPGSTFAAGKIATRLSAKGRGYVLSGKKIVVPYGAACEFILVSAVDDAGEIVLALLNIRAAGITRVETRTFDERRVCAFDFNLVPVSREDVFTNAAFVLDEAIDRGVAASCAEALGCMSELLERTVEHLKTRVQFGRRIGAFQVLQHRAVDMLIATELARSIVLAAIASIDSGNVEDRRSTVAAARLTIAETGRAVAEAAIQLHGAMGLTEEFAVGHYAKRLAMIAREYGDDDLFLERFAAATTRHVPATARA